MQILSGTLHGLDSPAVILKFYCRLNFHFMHDHHVRFPQDAYLPAESDSRLLFIREQCHRGGVPIVP